MNNSSGRHTAKYLFFVDCLIFPLCFSLKDISKLGSLRPHFYTYLYKFITFIHNPHRPLLLIKIVFHFDLFKACAFNWMNAVLEIKPVKNIVFMLFPQRMLYVLNVLLSVREEYEYANITGSASIFTSQSLWLWSRMVDRSSTVAIAIHLSSKEIRL